jgi:hypothetical protein
MNKPRFDSLLFQLSEEQQAQVYDWISVLGYAKSRDRLAEPPPVGLSLNTHINSLRRFYRRYSQQIESEELSEASSSVADSSRALLAAAEHGAHYAAFQLSAAPPHPDTFNQLSRCLTKQKFLKVAEDHVALARERLALDHQKFQFNAARQALLKLPELAKIMNNPATDDEDKIWAARSQLFGAPFPLNPNLNLNPNLDPGPPDPPSTNPEATP